MKRHGRSKKKYCGHMLEEFTKRMNIEKGTYVVGFNEVCEVQLNVKDKNDLEELWEIFCTKNELDRRAVDYVKLMGKGE